MIVKCNKCGTEMELPAAMCKDGLHFSCCQCSSRFSYFNGRIYELKKPDRIPLPGGWKNHIKSRVRKLARLGIGLKMIFLLAFTVMFVIGIGIAAFISLTSTTAGKLYIGRKFAMEDYNINDVSNAPKSENYSSKTESEKLLEDCTVIIRGRTVPKPFDFHSMKISFSPKSKTIYSVSGIIKKNKGVFVEEEAIKNAIVQCMKFVNDEVGEKPIESESIFNESWLFCKWETSTVIALVVSGRYAGEIRMNIFSPRLYSKAFNECPTGVSDEKVINDKWNAMYRDIERRKNYHFKERMWYLEQLSRNNLQEHSFQHTEKDGQHSFFLCLFSTDIRRSEITIIETAFGMIICEGIETSYAKQLMDARKKMFAVDGK